MKRFLLLLFLFVLFAAGCKLNSDQFKEHWIAAKIETDNNTYLVTNSNPYACYYVTKLGTELQIQYFLIPETTLPISDITIKSLDENIVEIKSIDYTNNTIQIYAKNIGNTTIELNTNKYKKTSVTLYCQTE